MERKASDVLLELEKKADQILQYLKNIDFNNKLILEKLNKMSVAPVVTAPVAPAQPPAPQRKTPSAGPYLPPTPPTAIAPGGKTTLVPKPVVNYEFHEVNEDGEEQIQEDVQPKLGRRDIRTPMQQDKKTQVQQKIVYPDGKNVILASVEIFSFVPDAKGRLEKKLVKQTRTNSSGKWLAALEPGKYSIRIFKTATTNKPVVEQDYEVEIPLSEAPLELEPSQV